jgi:hypothetical protein
MFNWGEFESNAGLKLPFKLELDDLTDADWHCLARIVARRQRFTHVEGVPTGGLKFAAALEPYALGEVDYYPDLLIVDDVLTTGGSMERQRAGRRAHGVVVFARGNVPAWITPIFELSPRW